MADEQNDWYLGAWLKQLKRKQADLVRDLDLNKAKVSLTLNGKQPYDRDLVNQIAEYLELRPYELLMHPEDALRIRRFREDAIRIASEERAVRETSEKKVSLG